MKITKLHLVHQPPINTVTGFTVAANNQAIELMELHKSLGVLVKLHDKFGGYRYLVPWTSIKYVEYAEE